MPTVFINYESERRRFESSRVYFQIKNWVGFRSPHRVRIVLTDIPAGAIANEVV